MSCDECRGEDLGLEQIGAVVVDPGCTRFARLVLFASRFRPPLGNGGCADDGSSTLFVALDDFDCVFGSDMEREGGLRQLEVISSGSWLTPNVFCQWARVSAFTSCSSASLQSRRKYLGAANCTTSGDSFKSDNTLVKRHDHVLSLVESDEICFQLEQSEQDTFQGSADGLAFLRVYHLIVCLLQFLVDLQVLHVQ